VRRAISRAGAIAAGASGEDAMWGSLVAAQGGARFRHLVSALRSRADRSRTVGRMMGRTTTPRTANNRSLPPVLINTMPKSGSVYLTSTIASSLAVEY
jgi:hypothetical protein